MPEDIKWDEPETVIDAKEFHERARKDAEKEYTEEEARVIKEKLTFLNDRFMQGELVSPDNIYLDLALLKDFNLGTLFAMISRRENPQKDFEYIKSRLKDYQIRLFDAPITFFPELNITEEEFNEFRNDPKYHNEIYVLSPFTVYQYVIKDNLKKNAQHAHMKAKYTDRRIPGSTSYVRDFVDITYYINTYPLELSEHNRKNLQVFFSDNLGVNTVVFSQDVSKISLGFFDKVDEISAYSVNKLMENEGLRSLLGKEKYIGKHIFTPLMFTSDKEKEFENKEEQFAKEKKLFHALMALCCHFHWLEAARYSVDLSVYENNDTDKNDEEIREAELPAL